jgi:hypothetical protein
MKLVTHYSGHRLNANTAGFWPESSKALCGTSKKIWCDGIRYSRGGREIDMISTHVRFLAIMIVLATPVASLAGVTIGANQRTVVHKSSNGVAIAFPDVCKTPSPGGPIPIPYPNIGKSADTSKSSKPTKLEVSAVEMSAEDRVRQTELAGSKTSSRANVDSYSLDAKVNGRLNIRRTAGKDSITKATYVDGEGNKLPLREPALIELANGELCGICATKDGRVTAVYRLLPKTRKRKRN